ncbi:hypothetical protein BH23ACT3_BH23ACT3_14920 [soil metagenome]
MGTCRGGGPDRAPARAGTRHALWPPTDDAIDFAFIDADKGRYLAYYTELLDRLRPGGLICADNTLWSGAVAHETDDADTAALQEFNDHVAADSRVESYILPVADGLTLIRKR